MQPFQPVQTQPYLTSTTLQCKFNHCDQYLTSTTLQCNFDHLDQYLTSTSLQCKFNHFKQYLTSTLYIVNSTISTSTNSTILHHYNSTVYIWPFWPVPTQYIQPCQPVQLYSVNLTIWTSTWLVHLSSVNSTISNSTWPVQPSSVNVTILTSTWPVNTNISTSTWPVQLYSVNARVVLVKYWSKMVKFTLYSCTGWHGWMYWVGTGQNGHMYTVEL